MHLKTIWFDSSDFFLSNDIMDCVGRIGMAASLTETKKWSRVTPSGSRVTPLHPVRYHEARGPRHHSCAPPPQPPRRARSNRSIFINIKKSHTSRYISTCVARNVSLDIPAGRCAAQAWTTDLWPPRRALPNGIGLVRAGPKLTELTSRFPAGSGRRLG